MKKHTILIIFNIIFFAGLLYIQVNWIIRVAEKEEAIFSQKVRMALAQTINEIKNDTIMCHQMKYCFVQTSSCGSGYYNLGEKEKYRFDCLIKRNLKNLDINLDYDFDIIRDTSDHSNINEVLGNNNYTESLEEALDKAGIHIKINFPDKSEFIISQIGFMFITSVILIILITASFIITILNYQKEKKLAERIKNFINNMVHEFKTPLANVALANNMIKKHITDNNKINRYTSIIKDENKKLEKQIERILQIPAFEHNKNKKLYKVDIHEIIKNSARPFEFSVNENGGKINFKLKASETFVKGEENHLTNTISNILDNAVKYSDKQPEITIETYNSDDEIIIKISDNGIGIDKKQIPLIFDKYYRVSTGDIHNVKGFGIGLAYVKSVVESYNGKILVESKIGKGCIFNIYLPLLKTP